MIKGTTARGPEEGRSMKKILSNPKVQKCFLPLAFLCIFPIWLMLLRKAEQIPAALYVLAALSVIFLCLDRILKPWDRERAEQMRKPGKPDGSGTEEADDKEQ